jgi:HK97 family phage major capsid protein
MTTTATPTTPLEWEEYLKTELSTPEKYQAAMADGRFSTMMKGYTQAQNKTMDELKNQVTEQVQASVLEMFKRNGAVPTNRVNLSGQRGAANYNDKAVGAGLNGKYKSSAEFFQNALRPVTTMSPEQRSLREELLNYSSNTGEGGGYLVPEEWRSELFSGPAMADFLVRPLATVIPMASKTLHFPAVDFTTEVGEVLGGIICYWMDEDGTIPDTSAAFAQIELIANRLAAAAVVPNDTLKDAGALDTWLRSMLPKAVREFEDRAFIKGNGVKKPLGALTNHPSMIVQGDESGQSTASITWNNVLDMASRLLPESWNSAVWAVTPDAFREVYTMANPVGTGGDSMMVGGGTGAQAPAQTLLGRPLKWTRKAPGAMGTQGDISLADFSYYAIGDRQDVRLETSEHAQFLADKTVFKVIERVDGTPLLLAPLTPENGGPTLSAFVQLETRTTD